MRLQSLKLGRMDPNNDYIHLKFTNLDSPSHVVDYMYRLVKLCFSAWKNTLQKSVVQKLILFQSRHSLVHPFTSLPTEKWLMYHVGYQTYCGSDHIWERDFNRSVENSMYYLRHHSFHLLLKRVHWHGIINTVDGFCLKPASYETFSFLSEWEGFKQFTTVLSGWNALGAQKVDC